MTLDRESIAEAQLLGRLAGDPNTFTSAQWAQLAARARRLLDVLDENPGPGDERQRRLCGGVEAAAAHHNAAALDVALWHFLADPGDEDYSEEEEQMTEEIPDNEPDEPTCLTDKIEPCWYCGADEMGVECGSMVCHEEDWRWR
jgi:hypothetical protein